MKYFLSLLAVVFSCNAYSQITVVDTVHCLNHTLHAEVTGGLIPTTSGITADDGWSGVFPIGFTFNFYGAPYTQCIIGSNGCLGFNLGSAGGYNTWPISSTLATTSATDIRNVICGPWCDVFIPAGGTIEYSMQGTAPFRNFAVTWCGTAMYSCTSEWLTTQIIIYETTGIVEVHIGHRTACLTGWNGQHAICGVRNAAGTVSTVAPGPPVHDYPVVWTVSTPEAWRFTPSPGPSYTVSSIAYAPIPYAASGIYWYDSLTHTYLGTGANLIVAPTVPTTYEACALGCNDTTKAFIHVLPATCFHAIANNPCLGDTLKLGAVGDSTGATYSWTGPAGYTNTAQYPFIYPSTLADQGLYRVVKLVAGSPVDTDSVYVVIHPLPVVTVSSNAPLCVGIGDSLKLFVNLDSLGETFSWAGPALFTSTMQLPTVYGFNTSNIGVYHVTGKTIWGCKDTASLYAGSAPPPPAPIITGKTQYCYGEPFIPFTVTGVSILWYPTSTSTVGTATPPVVPTSTPGTYTYYATQTAGCLSPKDSITVIVYPQLIADYQFTIHRACTADTVDFWNTSANGFSYTWQFGDGSLVLTDTGTALLSHRHVYASQGVYSVTVTAYNPVCPAPKSYLVDTRHSLKADFSPAPDTACLGTPISFTDLSTTTVGSGAGQINSWAWTFGNGDNAAAQSPVYTYPAPGMYPVSLTITDSIKCVDSVKKSVYVFELGLLAFHDTTLCLSEPLQLHNIPVQTPDLGLRDYTYSWTPATGLSDPAAQQPFFNAFGSYTYYITDGIPQFNCYVTDSVHVNSIKGAQITNLTASQTIPYGNSIQLNAGNQVLYRWIPNDGSLDNNNINNPVATPGHTTTYWVYGLDVNGCLDSASLTVYVDTSMFQDIPSGFTPNGDGLNDIFLPTGVKFQRLVEFRIFNRWGEEVFYSNTIERGWDGTYKNKPQDMGVYSYLIVVAKPGGENVVYKGNVTLIR